MLHLIDLIDTPEFFDSSDAQLLAIILSNKTKVPLTSYSVSGRATLSPCGTLKGAVLLCTKTEYYLTGATCEALCYPRCPDHSASHQNTKS
ncbi:hypothetical protein E2C01_064194 [Portunus trituberculatus]|uniref:Uncharacterized protein n=1 Tax=Portunus trituberculatus TaxID=210409 RepID=A0A5B7HB24_PORTR|nr:hypothetical protein [Portunus trituberculatus]